MNRAKYEALHQEVDFFYSDYGYQLDIRATFSRSHTSPTFDGPYDADWDIDDCEIIDTNGDDVGGELDAVFIKFLNRFKGQIELKSIRDDIHERAFEELG